MTLDVTAVGDLFADLIVHGTEKPRFGQAEVLADDYEIEIGGSAPIFAAQIARLGGRAALVGVLGDDLLGREVRRRLDALGVDVSQVGFSARRRTPLGLNLNAGIDRAMVTVLGAITELGWEAIPASVVAATRHWHIAGYFLLENLRPGWPRFAAELRRQGKTVSLDSNWAPRGDWNGVYELLPHVDVFLPNENEALAITGASDCAKAGAELARHCPLVVVKRGAEGASAFTRAATVSVPVASELLRGEFVDAVGAGDNFDAGFVWAWLNRQPLEACLSLAVTCGTRSTRAAGGINGQFQPVPATP